MIAPILATLVGIVLIVSFGYLDHLWGRRIAGIFSDCRASRRIREEYQDQPGRWIFLTWREAGIVPKSTDARRYEYVSMSEDAGFGITESFALLMIIAFQVGVVFRIVTAIATWGM